jgi:hypothetical protein
MKQAPGPKSKLFSPSWDGERGCGHGRSQTTNRSSKKHSRYCSVSLWLAISVLLLTTGFFRKRTPGLLFGKWNLLWSRLIDDYFHAFSSCLSNFLLIIVTRGRSTLSAISLPNKARQISSGRLTDPFFWRQLKTNMIFDCAVRMWRGDDTILAFNELPFLQRRRMISNLLER